jgi:ankyrin repeat protein
MTDVALQQLCDLARRGEVDQVQAMLATWPGRAVDQAQATWLGSSANAVQHAVRSAVRSAVDAAVINDHADTVAAICAQYSAQCASAFPQLLTLAAFHCSVRAVACLVTAKAGVDWHCTRGDTPLSIAAAQGHLPCVSLLLAAKADVHERTTHGCTALHCAAKNGHADVTACLLRANACVHTWDFSCQTPVYSAARGMHMAALQVLLDAHESTPLAFLHLSPLIGASYSPHRPDIFRLLLGAKADVHATEPGSGNTVLCLAIEYGCPDTVVKLLLRAKINVCAPTLQRTMALHHASRHGRRSTVDLLLQAKADVRATNTWGYTAVSEAHYRGHFELVAYLTAIAGV